MKRPVCRGRPVRTKTRRLLLIVAAVAMLLSVPVRARSEGSDSRQPVPAEAARDNAIALAREVFAQQIESARTPVQQADLAEKLLEEKTQGLSEPAELYAVLSVARALAVGAGEARIALAAAGRIAASFQVEPLELKSETLELAEKNARTTPFKVAVAEAAVALIDEAMAADRPELAARVASAALQAARESRDKDLRQEVESRHDRVQAVAEAHQEYETALAALEADPVDAGANLAAGRYLCLVRGDWERGVALLALGSDPELQAQAERELRCPATPGDELSVADGWWELAEKARDEAREQLRLRAATWYQHAAPKLAGIDRVKAEKRVSEVPGPVPCMYEPGRVIDPSRIYGGKKILLIFSGKELDVAEEACEKYGMAYDTAGSYDMNRTDYSAYHTIISGSNAMDYWGSSEQRKQPEAFQHLEAFVTGGGHLIVMGCFNGRNMEQLHRFGITTGVNHATHFERVPGESELLFAGNEDIVPKDNKMRSAGSFRISVPHVVLLNRGPGNPEAPEPALATLEYQEGRVTFTAVEPDWMNDNWLITCLLSWVARGCPT